MSYGHTQAHRALKSGLGGRIRTADLMLPKHPRYQLRYTENDLAPRDRFERPTRQVEAGRSCPLS